MRVHEEGRGPQRIDHIELIILQKFKDPQFDVRHLAEASNISIQYLYEVVYFSKGMSPRRLIETHRLAKALRLMADGTSNLMQICIDSGFQSYQTFRSAMKNRLGMAPRTCRALFVRTNRKEITMTEFMSRLRLPSSFKK